MAKFDLTQPEAITLLGGYSERIRTILQIAYPNRNERVPAAERFRESLCANVDDVKPAPPALEPVGK